MNEFQIDFYELQNCFSKSKEDLSYTNDLDNSYKSQTLKQLCIENKYNYDVIKYALKLYKFFKQDSLEQLIDRAIESLNYKEQNKAASWIYEKYGTSIENILDILGLNLTSIFKNMTNHVVCIEDALQHDAFKRIDKRENEVWIEVLYKYIIIEKININKNKNQITNDLLIASQDIAKSCQLTNRELEILIRALSNYVKIMKQYQIASIELGLEIEEQEEQKVKKNKF